MREANDNLQHQKGAGDGREGRVNSMFGRMREE